MGHWDNEPNKRNASMCSVLAMPYQSFLIHCYLVKLRHDGDGGWNTSAAVNIVLSESLLDLQALRYDDLSDVTVSSWTLTLSIICEMYFMG